VLTYLRLQLTITHMRITLDLPDGLLEEARAALGMKSRTDTVVLALRELVRRRRLEELKSLMGRVRLDVDPPRSRRRYSPGRSTRTSSA
jgi:Arc/MetJ family transcription regulator